MPKWLQTLLTDKDGVGVMRFALLIWVVGLVAIWAVSCYHAKALVDLPSGVVNVTWGMVGGKVAQKWVEGKQTEVVAETTTK